jgi:signal peptidase I
MINVSHAIKSFPRKLVTDRWLEEFEKTGKGWLRILSGSMSPLIQSGDQIFIEKVTPSKIYIGDIITFWKGNVLVTHRVIRKVRKEGDIYFIERGDRYLRHSLVASRSLMGKVRQIKKGAKNYNIDSLIWQLFNRIVGITFFCAFATRMISRKIPFFPKFLKYFVKNIYKIFGLASDKMLGVVMLLKK